jgi:hypothetical protein
MALTVDDGASVPVVGAFAQFCLDTGTRLTFFVNGANSSWSVNASALRPMVDAGQIHMANHGRLLTECTGLQRGIGSRHNFVRIGDGIECAPRRDGVDDADEIRRSTDAPQEPSDGGGAA